MPEENKRVVRRYFGQLNRRPEEMTDRAYARDPARIHARRRAPRSGHGPGPVDIGAYTRPPSLGGSAGSEIVSAASQIPKRRKSITYRWSVRVGRLTR
jgi:hypothetical protein